MADRITMTRSPRGTAMLQRNHYPHPSFSATGTQVQLSNYVLNPRVTTTAGFAAGFGTGGAGTAAIVTNGGPNGAGNSYRMTWTAAAAVGTSNLELASQGTSGTVQMAAGVVNASVYVRASKAQLLQLVAVGGSVSYSSSPVLVPANTWVRLSATVTMSALAAPLLRVVGATGTGAVAWASGDTLEAGCYAITQSDAPLPWFDGSTAAVGPYTFGWQGAVGASYSNRFAPGLQDVPSFNANGTLVERGESTLGKVRNGSNSVQCTQLRAGTGAGVDFAGMSIGSFYIGQSSNYVISLFVWVPAGLPDPFLTVAGTGVDAQPSSATSTVKDAWTLLYLPIRTNDVSGGTVMPRLRFNGNMPAAAQFWADSMIVSDGTERSAYFDGEAASAGGFTYRWEQGSANIDNSTSVQEGDDPTTVVQPKLLLGYTSARTSQNRVHRVYGSDFPAVTLRAATRRAGTMRFLFDNEDDARWAERAHGGVGVWAYVDADHGSANMNYVVAEGGRVALEQQDDQTTWILSVDFEQVA